MKVKKEPWNPTSEDAHYICSEEGCDKAAEKGEAYCRSHRDSLGKDVDDELNYSERLMQEREADLEKRAKNPNYEEDDEECKMAEEKAKKKIGRPKGSGKLTDPAVEKTILDNKDLQHKEITQILEEKQGITIHSSSISRFLKERGYSKHSKRKQKPRTINTEPVKIEKVEEIKNEVEKEKDIKIVRKPEKRKEETRIETSSKPVIDIKGILDELGISSITFEEKVTMVRENSR